MNCRVGETGALIAKGDATKCIENREVTDKHDTAVVKYRLGSANNTELKLGGRDGFKKDATEEKAVANQTRCRQFGFPVNGFHPQWPGSQGFIPFPNTPGIGMEFLPSSFVEDRLNAKIEELIGRVRREEAQKFIKRKEELDACDSSAPNRPFKRQRRINESESEGTAACAEGYLAESSSCSDFSDVYSDVFVNSNVAQVIATPGGRVVAWNDKFLDDTGFLPNQVCSSLTVFNLIQAKMLPRLFDLFSLALRGGSPSPLILQSPLRTACFGGFQGLQAKAVEKAPSLVSNYEDPLVGSSSEPDETDSDETSSDRTPVNEDDADAMDATHASMTLPCVRFGPNSTPLLVTITLMNDVDPEKRCFHCVFSPDPNRHASDNEGSEQAPKKIDVKAKEIIGEIRRISHRTFANLL